MAEGPSAVSSAALPLAESPVKTSSELVVLPNCPNQTAWLEAAEPAAGPAAAVASGALDADVAAMGTLWESVGQKLVLRVICLIRIKKAAAWAAYFLPRLSFSLLFQFLDLSKRQGIVGLAYNASCLLAPF